MLCDFEVHDGSMICKRPDCGRVVRRVIAGHLAKCKSANKGRSRHVYLTDTILRDGVESEVHLTRPPCKHMRERTDKRIKQSCQTATGFLPVYKCGLHRLCSPFGKCVDANLIHPCPGCQSYAKPD